jgi:hypothetical protein
MMMITSMDDDDDLPNRKSPLCRAVFDQRSLPIAAENQLSLENPLLKDRH